jgi:hypothetical protein
MAMIIGLFSLSVTARYSCQVRVFRVCFIRIHALIGHDVKVETVLLFVSSASDALSF